MQERKETHKKTISNGTQTENSTKTIYTQTINTQCNIQTKQMETQTIGVQTDIQTTMHKPETQIKKINFVLKYLQLFQRLKMANSYINFDRIQLRAHTMETLYAERSGQLSQVSAQYALLQQQNDKMTK